MTKNKSSLAATVFFGVVFLACCTTTKVNKGNQGGRTYTPADSVLYNTIIHQDSILFNTFNSRDLEKLRPFFTENLKVYQDNTGVRNYAETMESFKGLFEKDYVLTRKIMKETVEVYPINNYGAIETG